MDNLILTLATLPARCYIPNGRALDESSCAVELSEDQTPGDPSAAVELSGCEGSSCLVMVNIGAKGEEQELLTW